MIIIDRIEEEMAVAYSGDIRIEIPLAELPEGTREGSVLRATDSGYELDLEAEAERRARIASKMKRLFK